MSYLLSSLLQRDELLLPGSVSVPPVSGTQTQTGTQTQVSQATPYQPKTYNTHELSYKDGKLFAGDAEVNQYDLVNAGEYNNIGISKPIGWQDKARPVWSYDNLAGIIGDPSRHTQYDDAGKITGYKGQAFSDGTAENEIGFDKLREAALQGAANSRAGFDKDQALSQSLQGANGNAYKAGVDPVKEFAKNYRDALYGAYLWGQDWEGNPIESADDEKWYDPAKFKGESDFSMEGGRGERGAATVQRAQYVQNVLKKMFPDISQDDMDQAAYRAQKAYATDPARGRQDQWYYAMNPNDIVRQIGKELGGVTEAGEKWLQSTDAQMTQWGADAKKSAHAKDDADSLKSLGPVRAVATALQFTPLAPIGYGINAAISVYTKDPFGAIMSIAGMAGYSPAGMIGKTVAGSASPAVQNAIGSAAVSGVGAAINGKPVLPAMAIGGASAYAGSQFDNPLIAGAAKSGSSYLLSSLLNNQQNQSRSTQTQAQSTQNTQGAGLINSRQRNTNLMPNIWSN